MNEQVLKDYFENEVSVEFLANDLKDSQERTGFDTTAVHINQINNQGEFAITLDYLVRLCDDVIGKKLTLVDLNTIAFALITSEYFFWDTESQHTDRLENVLFDWDNPEIGFDLTIENVFLWKEYLQTGNYKLDLKSLKRKNYNGLQQRI